MTVIVFLIDNSASMNQRTYVGTTLLDVARGAVDQFLKMRQNYRNDRYLLVTFEEPPQNIKTVYIQANHQQGVEILRNELKNITANGVTSMGLALRRTFDFLNLARMKDQLDNYGLGVLPNVLENVVILAISDGQKITTENGTTTDVLQTLPDGDTAYPGLEMTKEAFRWDQRLYGLVLRIPAVEDPNFQQPQFIPHAESAPFNSICEATGGRTYSLVNNKSLSQCLESLHQKCQLGVVVSFEKIDLPEDAKKNLQGWEKVKRMIYLKHNRPTGWWPIPEPYWPDTNAYRLPQRSANPQIKFECKNLSALVVDNFPFDRYEVEPCPLTQYILERRDPNLSWPCYVVDSGFSGEMVPFGYLRPSSTMQSVCLIIHAYNYPVLLPLIDELIRVLNRRTTESWRNRFQEYLRRMPPYYGKYLSQAMERLALRGVIPEAYVSANPYSYNVTLQLNKSKKAAQQTFDLLMSQAVTRPLIDSFMWVPRTVGTMCVPPPRDASGRPLTGRPANRRRGADGPVEAQPTPLKTLRLAATTSEQQTPFSNPFHVKRLGLRTILPKMRKHLLCRLTNQRYEDISDESRFAMPIAAMGNFQRELERRTPPLRELFERPARLHTFGNPFKRDGAQAQLHIDEADEVGASAVGSASGAAGGQRRRAHEGGPGTEGQTPPKRKRGPLQRSITLSSLRSPRSSPAPHRERSVSQSSDDDIHINLDDLLEESPLASPVSSGGFSVEPSSFTVNGFKGPVGADIINGLPHSRDSVSDSDVSSSDSSLSNGDLMEDSTSAAAAARALMRRRQSSAGGGFAGGCSLGGSAPASPNKRPQTQSDKKFRENIAVYREVRSMIREHFISGETVYQRLSRLTGKVETRNAVLLALIAEARNLRVYKLEQLLDKFRVAMLRKASSLGVVVSSSSLSCSSGSVTVNGNGNGSCGRDDVDSSTESDSVSSSSSASTTGGGGGFRGSAKTTAREAAERTKAEQLLSSGPKVIVTEKIKQHRLKRRRSSSTRRLT